VSNGDISILDQNRILREQISQIKYFAAGSRIDLIPADDVEKGQTLFCHKSELHGLAASFLKPAHSCMDIGCGVRPQRLLTCPIHILVEPYQPYGQRLAREYPDKILMPFDALFVLRNAYDKSIDTIFLLDLIEHCTKEDGLELLRNALRVARKQVVIYTPLGFMPHHYSEAPDWGGIEHNILQNHLSGWQPEEFGLSINVVAEEYHTNIKGEIYGAFYSILEPDDIDNKAVTPHRVVLLSDSENNIGFEFLASDIIIADLQFSELSWHMNDVPKKNLICVPLQLIAENSTTPVEILRGTIINFRYLEDYLNKAAEVIAVGAAAKMVYDRYKNEWNTFL